MACEYTRPTVQGTFAPVPAVPDGWQAGVLNVATFDAWRNLLTTAAMSAFCWHGLPDGIDGRFVELTLLFQGAGGFFENVPGDLRFSFGAMQGVYDMCYNPKEVDFIAVNGAGRWPRRIVPEVAMTEDGLQMQGADATWAFDNDLRQPLMTYVDLYARRLGEIDRICDVNISAQATPWIGTAQEMARGDLESKLAQITGHEAVITQSQSMLSESTVEVLRTDAPYVVDKLLDAQERIVGNCLTMLGIDNLPVRKRERVNSEEAECNNELIAICRRSRLRNRQKLAEQTNALFGTDISVEWSVWHNDDLGPDGVGGGDDEWQLGE